MEADQYLNYPTNTTQNTQSVNIPTKKISSDKAFVKTSPRSSNTNSPQKSIHVEPEKDFYEEYKLGDIDETHVATHSASKIFHVHHRKTGEVRTALFKRDTRVNTELTHKLK
jgi:hypothetical protein